MKEFKFELGKKAKDIITDFTGVICGRAEYLTGCDQYCIQAKSKDGAKGNSIWIDENALRITKGKKLKIETDEASGGVSRWEPNK